MHEVLGRLTSALADRYRLERELGAGGMAIVYLAHDLRHDRRVALKVLRPELAAVVGADRFLAEIRTTANLQHPHILALFDSGQADGFLFYVMPFVEGESLRRKLDREGQLPVEEAVRIATAMAHALDYAHRQGVIHRDIKPENVLLQDGQPVVADFGIALAVSAAGGGRLTETGLSLGTPHYMSPEQASADREPGPRSDVYSLGCVLYEMLAGDPPHTGSSAQAVLARILTEDPRPVKQLRRSVPDHVGAAVARSLERLPADRFESAEAFAKALADSAFTHEPATGTPGRALPFRLPARAAILLPWGMAAVLATLMMVGSLRAPDLPATPATTRIELRLPNSTEGGGRRIAISPDGRWIAYSGTGMGGGRLYIRRSDQAEIRELTTMGGLQPDFSPDGAWVSFVGGGGLSKIPVEGGPPLLLARGAFEHPRWGRDGFIYFDLQGNLGRVPESGGAPEILLEGGGSDLQFPVPLPDGRGLLYTRVDGSSFEIELLDLRTRRTRALVAQGSDAQYVASGHLVYGHSSQTLMAVPFDLARHQVTGRPGPALPGVGVFPGGATQFAVSATGAAVYQDVGESSAVRLVLVDSAGRTEPLPLMAGGARGTPRFSPDGRSIAFEDREQIHVYDLEVGTNSPLTFEGRNWYPVWSRDGRTIGFSSFRSGSQGWDAYRVAADGGAPAIPLFTLPLNQFLYGWSDDESVLLVRQDTPDAGRDIYVVTVGDSVRSRPYLRDEWTEQAAVLSPDGRFVAYESNESGEMQIYVREFPEPQGKRQISSDGGVEPLWAPDGAQLYYRSADQLWAARVELAPTVRVLSREVVLTDVGRFESYSVPASYDLDPASGRFVFLERELTGAVLTVVVGWFEELKSRLQP